MCNQSKILSNDEVVSNEQIDIDKLNKAKSILIKLQKELENYISLGHGPFLAAIYDENENLIAKCSNSVINDNCSNCHAEVNVIKEAEKKLGYDLSPYNLSIYITSEPCIMCIGAIMWSGIRNVYYGVPSSKVEQITGFDEGFKPNWLNEFKKRGISVYGNIETKLGENVLKNYVTSGKKVYQPTR